MIKKKEFLNMIMNLCPEYWTNTAYTVNHCRHSFLIKSKAEKEKGNDKIT